MQVAAATPPATTYFKPFSAHGMQSSYHIYTDGIDRSKPVGVVFYFGGDYWKTSETWVHNPGGSQLKAMAAQARTKNMILVVPISPDKNASGDGITWWENIDKNGQYFRALKDSLIKNYGLDTSRVWLAGYSGGAEFITYEVLADQQNWIRGGGATIIGGGGANGMQTAPSAAVRKMPLTWHAGSKDVVGDTNPPEWSAKRPPPKVRRSTRTPALAGQPCTPCKGWITTATTSRPDRPRPQSRAQRGRHHGGGSDQFSSERRYPHQLPEFRWGRQVRSAHLGGTQDRFPRWCVPRIHPRIHLLLEPANPAAPVKWSGAIGASFKNAGYERAWGYPAHAERSASGGAYQDYRRGAVVNRAMWSPKTGVRIVKMTGGIGAAWRAAGYERNWGYPVTNEYTVARGVQQKFSNGRVATWNRSTGRVTVSRG